MWGTNLAVRLQLLFGPANLLKKPSRMVRFGLN